MATPAGERRIVAALFVDVAGSTAIAEQLGPDRSKFLFDEVVGLMAEQVRAYGGTVAQLTGDGLFAVFGAPVAHEDDSVRAVRAGRAIHDALGAYASDVGEAYGIRLAARVAVNTGPIVLVRDGAPDEQRYNALGDTANVAARLQAVAGDGGVAVGPETARHVGRAFGLEELGELELKGKSAPVTAFLVTEELEVAAAPARTPFVGRATELGLLTSVLEDAVDGRGAIVSITGEPGIGKTRIVREACGREAGVRVVSGHSLSYTESIPYWPVRDLLRDWLGVGVSDPEGRTRLELKAALAALSPDEADELYPFLATLLGLTLEPMADDRLQQLSRDSVQQQTVDSVVRVVAALAAERPVCLVLEDLHWADDATLDLVQELMPVVDDEAVVLFLLHRTERDHRSWDVSQSARRRFPHRYHEVELQALDEGASRELAAGAAGAQLPEALAALIAERAGGNPFFLEEALADLLERGAITKREGQLELSVPSAVQEALQARLDRLDPATREVVGVAAVIGQSFGLQLLELVAPEEGLRRALSELQRLDLVVEERRRPAPEYRFRHGLVQEVAYRSLLEPRRRALHGAVGRALESIHRDSPSEVYGLLAWHFSESDEPAAAVDYLLEAGDAARALFANEEAREFYRQAIDLLADDDPRSRDTLLRLGLSHHLAFEFEQASDAYERAFRLPEPLAAANAATAEVEVLFSPFWEFTPGHAYSTVTGWIAHQLFRGLLTLDAELNVVPDVAAEFAIGSDGLVYRFRLRPEATWSDGVPVTADDFAYTFVRMRAERVEASHLLEPIESATATDPQTLEIRLRAPSNLLLHLLTTPYAFPWPKHHCEMLGDAWREPANLVSNGPFVLASYGDDLATLGTRAGWHGSRGNVGTAALRLVPYGLSTVEPWERGEGEFLSTNTRRYAEDDTTVVEVGPVLATWYAGFRADAPPFDDERVRRAFALALDVDRTAHAWSGPSQPVGRGGFLPPAIPGHSHRIGLGHDPARARLLLAEAGYPDGRGLNELIFAIDDGVNEIPTYSRPYIEAWEALGARVRLEVVDLQGMVAFTRSRAHLWSWGWAADFPDPDAFLRSFVTEMPVYRDRSIDELLERVVTVHDQDERLRIHREIDRLLVAEHVSLVPTHYDVTQLVSRPWIHGRLSHPLLIQAPLDWLTVDEEARNKALARQT
ncbi:MAG TPA: ABC transporter substrate-binding protein [Gaiellaceae bacterium]|nr:ABC transporter substrate-binding protein [Gaiellaceae bacterium]